MNQNILSFLLSNRPVRQFNSKHLMQGEVWKMSSAEEVKTVSILIDTNLYLDVFAKHLQNQHLMEETNFSCFLDEDYSTIQEDDIYEIKGGTLAGITVHGEYIELGQIMEEQN